MEISANITGRLTRAIRITAAEESEIGSARRQAMALASSLDFDELQCGRLGIIVTEAAHNVSRHGGGGEILLTPWQVGESAGMDVVAIDRGAGIADVSTALRDGYSTGSTPGTGLGALSRQSDFFELDTRAGGGTAVLMQVLRSSETPSPALRMGSVAVPFGAETVSGDGWAACFRPGYSCYFMADGLGHGHLASLAAAAALKSFSGTAEKSTREILLVAHTALMPTRGAALAVAQIDHAAGVLRYSGSGNIAGQVITDGQARSMVSMNGTPGHSMGSVQEFSYPWQPESLLMMQSDGLATRWSLQDYPGLVRRHPALIAAVLYRDFSRKRDDATVLVAGGISHA